MKPILLILCTLFFSFTSIAQIPMDSLYRDNTRWINFADYTMRNHLSTTGFTNRAVVVEYKINGDSVVGADTFKKLYVRQLYHIQEGFSNYTQTQSVYIGRLRIDNRKLYYTNDSSIQVCYDTLPYMNKTGKEVLIADWGVNIGDTIKAGIYNSGKVKSIYPQLLPSGQTINAYIIYKYNQNETDTLLEGIGDSKSMFYPWCTLPDQLGILTEFKYYNLCFIADGIYYHSDAKSKYLNWYLMQNCFVGSKLDVLSTQITDNNFAISPNPSNGQFSIKGSSISEQTFICVYNNMGQRVYENTVTGRNINTQVQLNNSVPGIYTISIRSGDFVKHEKLIIQ